MLTLVADQDIPLVEQLFSEQAHLVLLPSTEITNSQLLKADALFVRSITKVNRELLQNTKVKFVGSMTAGIDHLDIEWLEQHRIQWANASGANANAVAEYVIATIAWLQQQKRLPLSSIKAGIVGIGEVGSRVANKLKHIGVEIILNDPPKTQREPNFNSVALAEFADLDLISLHLPLTKKGDNPTVALINNTLLAKQNHCVLLNTSRGEVIDAAVLQQSTDTTLCLDVYPNEPNIETDWIERALLSTPHIAGYSLDAKHHATHKIQSAFERYFGCKTKAPQTQSETHRVNVANATTWQECLLKIYDPSEDSRAFKEALASSPNKSNCFLQQRSQYPLRTEFSGYQLEDVQLRESDKKILRGLGFHL